MPLKRGKQWASAHRACVPTPTMRHLPQIADLPLQPLQVPGGWRITINQFYALDPDETLVGRQLLHIAPDSVRDPWDDVVSYYFDKSWLWLATRADNRYQLGVEWAPMGDRDGEFMIQQFGSEPIRFAHPPPRTIQRKRDDISITYDLNDPVTWAREPQRSFESRDREKIAQTLNRWLAECSDL